MGRTGTKYTAKWGVQIAGMLFQTRSSYKLVIFILEILEKNYNLDKCFSQLCGMIYTS